MYITFADKEEPSRRTPPVAGLRDMTGASPSDVSDMASDTDMVSKTGFALLPLATMTEGPTLDII
jgi:hypothetical protein